MKHWRFVLFVVVLLGVFTVPTIFSAAPTGAGPNDPLMVTGNWQTLAPNASNWFYFDYNADKSRAEVDLDVNGVQNVQLAIFTPDQAKAWLQDPTTKPVGLGSPPGAGSASAMHDLVWLGAFRFTGRYFAVATNNNPFPVNFRLLVSGLSVVLAPTATPTPFPFQSLATPVPVGNIQGQILFQDASGGNIYTVNGDGSKLTRVTYGLDPSWSPDGKRITFTRWNEPTGVFVANADGSNEQTLLGGIRQPLSPQWSPDGTKIAFARQAGGSTNETTFCFGSYGCFSFPANPYWKLGVIDVANKTLTEPQCSTHCFSPTWWTDNKTVAYADAAVGVMATNITSGPAWNLNIENQNVQSTSWSPDGSKIAYAFKQHDHWEIAVMNADGSGLHAVTQLDPLSFNVVNNVTPTWSPDSKQVLFLSDRNGKWEFFTVNPDGSNLQQVLKSVTDAMPIRFNFSNERVADWIK